MIVRCAATPGGSRRVGGHGGAQRTKPSGRRGDNDTVTLLALSLLSQESTAIPSGCATLVGYALTGYHASRSALI